MGGKIKQSQRTKNNARPSSSGRSAELLQSTGNLAPGQIFGRLQSTPLLFPTLSTPTLDQGLSQEYAICIKRLNKKDPITKVKALQELNDLVSNGNVDDVLLVLPSWAHFFKILAVDTDCKVREAAQLCHGSFARVLQRRLAPALRRVVPPWLQALHDDHAPAAALARASLQATFPENKLPEVINFCKEEIMSQVLDNIVGKSEKSLPKKSEDPEELEQQLQRLVAGSLQGLRLTVDLLPEGQLGWLQAALEPLLTSSAFWNLPTHSATRVRDAWFGSVSQLARRLGRERGLPAAAGRRILLAAAKDSLSQRHSWHCLLQLIDAVPDWYKWLDEGDLINKRILDLLEKGGWGDSRQLNDVLLPLLSNLPQDQLTKEFYEKLFTAFLKGLQKKCIMNSKSERKYWISNMSECLKHLSIQNYSFVVEVITSDHRNWLKTILSNQNENQLKANLINHSASLMTSLAKFWLKQSKELNGEKYDQLLRNFWQNICSTVLSQLETVETDALAQVVEGHIVLLQMLKREFSSEPKKVKSIKFEDETTAEDKVDDPEIDEVSVKRYAHNLNDVVQTICSDYFQYADKNNVSEPVFAPLLTILEEFGSRDIFLAIGRHFGVSELYDFYHNVLFKWLLDTKMECESLVDIVFLLLKYLTNEEQEAVFSTFDKVGEAALQRCVAHAAQQDECGAARAWLCGGAARRGLLRHAAAALQTRAGPILPLALTAREELIGSETASQIVEAVNAVLSGCVDLIMECKAPEDLEESKLIMAEQTVFQAAQLARKLAGWFEGNQYQDLVFHLFDFAMHYPGPAEARGAGWWRRLRGALPAARARLAPRLAAARARRRDTVDIVQIEHMASLCPYLCEEFVRGEPPAELAPLAALDRLLADLLPRDHSLEVFALRYDVIAGSLSCPFEDSDVIRAVVSDADGDRPTELTRDSLVPFLAGHVFRAAFLRTLLLHRTADEPGNHAAEGLAPESDENGWCEKLLGDDYFRAELCELLREHAVLRSLDEAYGFWAHHSLIRQSRLGAEAALREIVRGTPPPTRADILALLATRAALHGYYWPYAARYYQDKAGGSQSVADIVEALLDNTVTGNGFFHSLQAAESQQGDESEGPESGESGRDRRLRAAQLAAARAAAAAWPRADGAALAALADRTARPELRPLADLALAHRRLLADRDIESMQWSEVVAEAAALRFTALYMTQHGWDADRHLWDFANVGLCAALRNVAVAPRLSTKVAMVATAAAELFASTALFVRGVPAGGERREAGPHVASLPAEWRDVFAPVACAHLWRTAHTMLQYDGPELGVSWAWALGAVATAIRHAHWKDAEKTMVAQGRTLRGVCSACARVLSSGRPRVQQALAYCTLMAAVPALRAADEEQIAMFSKEEDKEESQRAPELVLDWMLGDIDTALDRALEVVADCTEGVTSLSPGAESAGYLRCLGALLLADAVAALADGAAGVLGHHYVRWYRDSRHAVRAVSLSLRLLPAELLRAAQTAAAPLPAAAADGFLRVQRRPPTDRWWGAALGELACRGVWCAVSGAGASCVRGWAGAGGRGGRALRRLLRAYCTPRLARRLLRPLLGSSELFPENVTRTVEWGSREATVALEVDEQTISLVITLAEDHPLTPPRVRCEPPPAHGQPHHAPDWIALYLAYQNGSALRAASMWARAVSRAVGDAEPCLICYCTLQARGRLPDQRCRQCRRRYHHQCLYTWFKTSQKTKCPLCRSNF